MAMNDYFRFLRTPLGLEIGVGAQRLQIREGYLVLPQLAQASEGTTEVGSVWNRSDDGSNQQRDSGGVVDL